MITRQVNKPLQKKRYSIVIPAAGMGYRMKGQGPKCLLDINGKHLIEHQIEIISQVFTRFEVILVVGFQYLQVREVFKQTRNFKMVVNYDFETTNVVKSIGLGLDRAEEKDVVVIYGDLLFNKEAITAPFGYESVVVLDQLNGMMDKDEVGVVNYKNTATNLMYGLPQKWAQIAYFTEKELALMKTICKDESFSKCFGFEAINEVIHRGGTFRAVCPQKIKAFDLDSSADFDKIGLI